MNATAHVTQKGQTSKTKMLSVEAMESWKKSVERLQHAFERGTREASELPKSSSQLGLVASQVSSG